MAATGGSMVSVTLDGRTFSVAADADAQVKFGGFENEVVSNGDGTARLLKTRVPWSAADFALVIDDDNGDLEFLQSLTNRNDFFPVQAEMASGTARGGDGQVTGEVIQSTANATASVGLMGQGEFTQL